jgi:hypothetical protein
VLVGALEGSDRPGDNLTLRHGISKLVRKSLCFSKCKEMLDDHLDLYQCYTNYIKMILFGSLAEGRGVPGSDADILIIPV